MNPYIEKMKHYISAHPVNWGDEPVESLMEMFYWCYAEHNPLDNAGIREKFGELREQYRQEGYADEDMFFLSVASLCQAHEQAAFLEGFRAGAQWMMEVSKM